MTKEKKNLSISRKVCVKRQKLTFEIQEFITISIPVLDFISNVLPCYVGTKLLHEIQHFVHIERPEEIQIRRSIYFSTL